MTLEEFLSGTVPTVNGMGVVHCTTAVRGIDVLRGGELAPTRCPVYGADLVYLFYGRPAYKPDRVSTASGIADYAPVCLVLDPSLLGAVTRILPFDSGGFGRYGTLVGPDLDLRAFELAGDPTTPLRLVQAFYRTNRNYYEQRPTLREADISFSHFSSRALARLIADPSIRDDDDRSGTIELQYSVAVPLAGALRAIVAPSPMLDDPETQRLLSRFPDAVPLSYKTYGRSNPLSFANTIFERVEAFQEREGWLS